MRLWGVVAVVAAGCGRIGFDAAQGDASGMSDGPSCMHDEDGDGVMDCVDRCPHIADPLQTDTDGDGVANACDPGTARQHLAYFNAFAGEPLPLLFAMADWSVVPDALHHDGTGYGQIQIPFSVSDVDIWVGATITALMPGQNQITLTIVMPNGSYYYGELNQQPAGTPLVGTGYWNGTGYTSLGTSVPLGAFPLGDITLRIGVRMGALQWLTQLDSDTGRSTAMAPVPAYIGGSPVQVELNNLVVDVRYVAIIETMP